MVNYWYQVHENKDYKTWFVEILANSDCIASYEDCVTEKEATIKAESFIDGVKFARAE